VDYPADRRQIVIVSDASTDRTDEIVRSYADHGVELLRMPQRGGKTAAENAARAVLRGEVVVNTDASVRIATDALKPLILALGDPTVGLASGRDVSVASIADTSNRGESGYVGYEMWVRRLETHVSGIVGASGCLYAIRRQLHDTLVPEALSRDFASALVSREHGFRAVSVDEAICFVPRTASLKAEYRRKVRTVARGMETLWFKRALLNPVRFGLFSWMLCSHKVTRWLAPWAVAAAGLAVLDLARHHLLAQLVVLAAAGAFTALAVAWHWPAERRLPRVIALPAFIAAGNLAVMHAFTKAIRGELNPIWEPTRRAPIKA
jgi:cellulose synthase/poly-beta-1,6-N-acetylglucosamine synthase-like glycosyltransferase